MLHIKILKENNCKIVCKKMFDLIHTPDPLDWGKGQTLKLYRKVYLIELSDLTLKHWLYYILDRLW